MLQQAGVFILLPKREDRINAQRPTKSRTKNQA